MNLQQLRYLREIVRRDLNLTQAAAALHTSQPGVSRQILELEDELGIEIFVRKGRRIVGLTEPGRAALRIAERMLHDLDGLKRVAADFSGDDSGTLRIATTHTQARYTLPETIAEFRRRFPRVSVMLQQSDPVVAVRRIINGEADLAVATEQIATNRELLALPYLEWTHVAVFPPGHPLEQAEHIDLEVLAGHPLLTYDAAFTGRTSIDRAFANAGIEPDIAVSALDADVIKTYVRLGMGVGLIAGLAFDPAADRPLLARDCGGLFGRRTSHVGLVRGRSVRRFVAEFVRLMLPEFDEKQLDA